MKRIRSPILILLICFSVLRVHAQYSGGNGSGNALTLLSQVSCSAIVYPAIYGGGNESSLSMLLLSQVSCSTPAYPSIFLGGNESSDNSLLLTQASCGAIVYPNIFAGGNDSSFNSIDLEQSSCATIVYPSIFLGGNETSDNSLLLTQTSCGAIVYPNIFAGGIDSSFNSIDLEQASCATPVYPSIFAGGIDDGYSGTALLQTSCATPVYPSIYAGGIDDGYSGTALLQTSCIILADPGIYVGGNSNVTTGVTYLTACEPFADFEADTQFVCEGDTVNFTDLSLGSPITWDWTFNGGAPLTSSAQNPFVVYNSAGTYNVQLAITTSSSGNSITKTNYIVVGAKPAASLMAGGSTSFCGGDSVQLTVNPAYSSYVWNTGATSQSVYASTSGSYFSVVTAANGCQANTDTVSVTVLSNPVPLISASGPTTLCNADTLILTSSPATSYNWLPGSESSQAIEVIASGTYYVEATYANGCSNISAPINAVFGTTPTTPVVTPSGSLTFCNGDSVVLTSSPAASYLWSPGAATAQNITVKNSGTYFVEVGNGTGCTATSVAITVNVLANSPTPTITASGPLSFCSGDSVVLTSSPASSYNWSPSGQISQSITVLNSGTFYVQADNGNNCPSVSASTVVTAGVTPATPTIAASGPLSFCTGDSVVLTASAAASYSWLPGGQTTQSITVATTGNYYVETGNATGCTAASAPVSVTVNAVPATPTISASGPLTFCAGDSVVLTASVAVSYDWLPGGQTTQSITVTTTGNYYVETANGSCTAQSLMISVNVLPAPAVPLVSASGALTFCEGDSVVLTSSIADSYVWNPGGSNNQSLTVLTSGIYFVEVSNSSGCSATSVPVLVTVNLNPSVNLNGSLVACVNTAEDYTTTNLGGVDYLWTIDNGTLVSGSGTNSVNVLFPDTGQAEVMVIVTNSTTSCFSESLIGITVLPAPQAYAGNDVSVCEGQSVQLQAFGGTTYNWLPPTGLSDPTIFNPVANPSTTTQYIVVVANGSCTDSDTVFVTVNPLPTVDAGPDAYIGSDSCAVLAGSGTGTYSWWPVVGLSNAFSAMPAACPDSTITYYLTVEGAGGCSATDSVTVYVTASGDELVFPNTFTPNGDGKNDVWYIGGLSRFPANRLTVFNRWGNQVFDAQPYENNWDGSSLGRELPDGTYFYVFDRGNGEELLKGYLMIIR